MNQRTPLDYGMQLSHDGVTWAGLIKNAEMRTLEAKISLNLTSVTPVQQWIEAHYLYARNPITDMATAIYLPMVSPDAPNATHAEREFEQPPEVIDLTSTTPAPAPVDTRVCVYAVAAIPLEVEYLRGVDFEDLLCPPSVFGGLDRAKSAAQKWNNTDRAELETPAAPLEWDTNAEGDAEQRPFWYAYDQTTGIGYRVTAVPLE